MPKPKPVYRMPHDTASPQAPHPVVPSVAPGAAGVLSELRPELEQSLQTLGLSLSASQIDQILGHLQLLQKWNRVHNLTAIHTPVEALRLHALDCLATVPVWLKRHPAPVHLLDVGSGAGFPAIIYAIVWPQTQVCAVDAVGKKAAFIQQVALQLGLKNLVAQHARVQDLRASFDVVTCRAFAALPDLVSWTHSLLTPQGRWACLKGKPPQDEIKALSLQAQPQAQLQAVDDVRVPGLNAERCLVWLGKPTAPR